MVSLWTLVGELSVLIKREGFPRCKPRSIASTTSIWLSSANGNAPPWLGDARTRGFERASSRGGFGALRVELTSGSVRKAPR